MKKVNTIQTREKTMNQTTRNCTTCVYFQSFRNWSNNPLEPIDTGMCMNKYRCIDTVDKDFCCLFYVGTACIDEVYWDYKD